MSIQHVDWIREKESDNCVDGSRQILLTIREKSSSMEVEVERKRQLREYRRRWGLYLGILSLSFVVTISRNICFGWSARAFHFSGYHHRQFYRHNSATTVSLFLSTNQKESEPKVSSIKSTSTISWASRNKTTALLSSQLLSSSTFSTNILMDPIVNHPSVELLDLERRPRKKLKPRHKHFFLPTMNTTSSAPCFNSGNNDNSIRTHLSLFEKLAVACCDSGVVPRKEFFETYAAAKIIHDSFPESVYRIADLAAGHGLLSWMLLAMDEYSDNGTRNEWSSEKRFQRTAICVDRRMPPSAIAIAKSMRKHLLPVECIPTDGDCSTLPESDSDASDAMLYDQRWTYVETDLGNVVVDDSSTLLVSVHACGTLSDFLIQMAISGNAPLSLVPCCHTYSARKGYTPHPSFSGTTADEVRKKIEKLQRKGIEDRKFNSPPSNLARKSKTHQKFQIVENVIDEVRLETLNNAGYGNVRVASLPKVFTERNRLFLAQNATVLGNKGGNVIIENVVQTKKNQSSAMKGSITRQSIRKGSMPPIVGITAPISNINTIENCSPKGEARKQQPDFAVYVRDNPKDILNCVSVSGKAKAIQRLRALLPNHFAPKLDVSIWLSPVHDHIEPSKISEANGTNNEISTNVTLEALQQVLDDVVKGYLHNQMSTTDGNKNKFRCTISAINKLFVHPENGRTTCTYQIEYSYDCSSTIEENASPFPKKIAKELHKSFCENVVRRIDGTEIR